MSPVCKTIATIVQLCICAYSSKFTCTFSEIAKKSYICGVCASKFSLASYVGTTAELFKGTVISTFLHLTVILHQNS